MIQLQKTGERMRKTILYIAMSAAIAAVSVIAIIGCNDGGANAGRVSEEVNAFLNKFDNAVPAATVTKPPQFTVYFNSNGGGNVPASVYADSGKGITLPEQQAMERAGHSFGGWSTNSGGTGETHAGGAYYTVTRTVTLYAVWTPKTYTLTLKIYPEGSGSVSIEPDKENYAFDDAVTVTATPSSTEYEFTSWSGASSSKDNSVTITMDGSKTLTAGFRRVDEPPPPRFTVTFNSNGGGIEPPEIPEYSGADIMLPDQLKMQKNGYSFGGWNTKSDGTGSAYQANSYYTVTQNITLFAKWIPVYTVTFNGNGGGDAPNAKNADSGSTITLPYHENLARSGYTIGGWNTSAAGTGTNYAAGASYTVAGNITLYAKWTLNAYTITFNANGGSVTSTSGLTGDGWKLSSLPAPTRSCYTFGGWYTAATNGTAVTTGTAFSGDATIYAQWNAVSLSYTLTTNISPTGGGTVSRSPNQTAPYSCGTSVTVTAAAASGYVFTGWSGAATSSSASVSVTMNSEMTLTANFRLYKMVTIGGKKWMAENLNYDTANGTGSWCYGNSQDSCTKYGRLYNWKTAMAGASSSTANPSGVQGVCPSGWHLPSSAEWQALVDAVGGYSTAGKHLKSKTGWTAYSGIENLDTYGFSALPGGLRLTGGSFGYAGPYGIWWTATANGSGYAYTRGMDHYLDLLNEGNFDVSVGLSVRCVGD
jgi:uncharacterized protein (TIGR02145 family)/uncharacterized repeat protein (TIGR02543 family)